MVPDTVGVNNHDRSVVTDAQAIGFGPKDATVESIGSIESQLFQSSFEIIPRYQALSLGATEWFGLICTN